MLLQKDSQTKKELKSRELDFQELIQKHSTQRAVLDSSVVNFPNWRGCTNGQEHTSPKKVPTEPLPEGAKVDLLPFQRWEAGREAPTSSVLFQSCTYKIPEVAGSQVHVVGRCFSFQGQSFVRSEPWGYDQMLNWGNQRGKSQRWAFGYCQNKW